ncbi:MAG: Stp1/IreP family PP2C-type Ser/Thr phosphatase [Eubacteriales bacterium]|nr:Stp1/IreP family PP2C-type Ser/Thr phosphatase [Eubacteriales bacterium]
MGSVKVKFSGITNTGLVREINQDSFRIIERKGSDAPVFLILADGMGGHNAGELASSLAVEYAAGKAEKAKITKKNSPGFITKTMNEANALIYEKAQEDIAHIGMGTTMIMAIVGKDEISIGNVGDSRVYLIRGEEIKKITTDHSLIEELVNSGAITKAEAENHPSKNIITKALGSCSEVLADIYNFKTETGDKVLLCTDGLTNMVRENEIYSIMKETENPEESCRKLIEKANEYGGEDNITAIAVYF